MVYERINARMLIEYDVVLGEVFAGILRAYVSNLVTAQVTHHSILAYIHTQISCIYISLIYIHIYIHITVSGHMSPIL